MEIKDDFNLIEHIMDCIKIQTEPCPRCKHEWLKIDESDEDLFCDCGELLVKGNETGNN